MKKNKFIPKVAKWVRKKGYEKIKANCSDFDTPVQFNRPQKDQHMTPDVTGELSGRKSYFEVAIKTEEKQRTITKWRLLDTLARMKGGNFYLIVPKGHKAFATRIVKRHNLNANILQLESL